MSSELETKAEAESKAADYPCPHCDKEYTTTSNLNRHIRTVHPTIIERFSCFFCETRFAVLADLQEHSHGCTPSLRVSALLLEPQPVHSLSVTTTATGDDFLKWMGEPPINQFEQTVKTRCKTTEKQLAPERATLKMILSRAQRWFPVGTTVDLGALTHVGVVQPLMELLEKEVKSERLYQVSLLLKKVCAYFSARQSFNTKLYIQPNIFTAWSVICAGCQTHGTHRKLAQRDRMVLYGEDIAQTFMSPSELETVIAGCLNELTRLQASWQIPTPGQLTKRYTDFFVTACMIMLFAPRQQTMRQLSTDTLFAPRSPGNSEDCYVVKISAEFSKIGQPVVLRFPDELVDHLVFYLKFVLGVNYRGPLFLQRGGKRRENFSIVTKAVTEELLGRGINAHSFRHSVATSLHRNESVTDEQLRGLATTMNHSSRVQNSHYVFQDRLQSQARLHQQLGSRSALVPQKRAREEKEEEEEEQKE